MSNYVENNLGKDETIVKKIERNPLFLLGTWIKAAFFLILLLLIPAILNMLGSSINTGGEQDEVIGEVIEEVMGGMMNSVYNSVKIVVSIICIINILQAIIRTIQFLHVELGITNKRLIGKVGVFNTRSLDAPLNKIQSVSVSQSLFGKIFNYGTIVVQTAALESFSFCAVKNTNAFKGILMAQIDQYEEDLGKKQAAETAKAMAEATGK